MKRTITTVLSLCLSLSGCFAFVLPIGGEVVDVPASSAGFNKIVADTSAQPKNNAVAVAKDPAKWSVGGWQGATTVADAKDAALRGCEAARARDGVVAPCVVSHVNGVAQY